MLGNYVRSVFSFCMFARAFLPPASGLSRVLWDILFVSKSHASCFSRDLFTGLFFNSSMNSFKIYFGIPSGREILRLMRFCNSLVLNISQNTSNDILKYFGLCTLNESGNNLTLSMFVSYI